MNLLHATAELQAFSRPVCLAIGVFDGVHLGHQRVIRKAVEDAARHGGVSVVITFDRHPAAVLAPARVPPLIYPLSRRLRAIESLGPDAACVIHFDNTFSQTGGEEFVRGLARDCGRLLSLSVGRGFAFGRGRSGNVALLNALGRELHFAVHALAEVSLDGRPVSSTRVREAAGAGRFEEAGRMLGRPYALCGNVIKGSGVGRQMGVPTANLDTTGLVLPPSGVYAARALVRGGSHAAAVNIGCRPTLTSAAPQVQVEAQPIADCGLRIADSVVPQVQVEAHLLDFAADIYGEEMELAFVKKLREERRFDGLSALREQIARDIARARELAGDAQAGLRGSAVSD
jgi:riboflavin kinase/FMN adenylyltransferase